MKKANGRNKWRVLIIPVILVILINVISLFPFFVETYYTQGFYVGISTTLRFLFGWIPFSIGDILYLLVIIWAIVRLYKTIRAIFTKQVTKASFANSVRRSLAILLWAFVIFYSFWGINYDRLGIAYQLRLQTAEYTKADLQQLTASLISRINTTRKQLGDSAVYGDNKTVFKEAESAYAEAEKKFPFLHYRVSSVKSSMWGTVGDYAGFLGYYNPFTGEAQVNTTVPRFLLPFTTCHEMGHQLGYGSEDEANFSGFLAAMSSTDLRFHYSAFFDLYNYANSELFRMDSLAARSNYKLLDTLVKKDIQDYKRFLLAHQNPIEPYIDKLYGKYLQANNQPKGLETYDEVVGWLIAYTKKYGSL